jgi:hypothetical protein
MSSFCTGSSTDSSTGSGKGRQPAAPRWWSTFRQMVRYGVNCGLVLGVKLVLIVALSPWLAPAISYLLIHVVTFFLSYAIHTRHTFRTAFSGAGMVNYLMAVAGFKLFDYLLFNLLVAWEFNAPFSVILASAIEAVARFLVVRRILTRGTMPLIVVPAPRRKQQAIAADKR